MSLKRTDANIDGPPDGSRGVGGGSCVHGRHPGRANCCLRQLLPCVVWIMASSSAGLTAQRSAVPASEYDIKAAYLYNFVTYTEWPANAFISADAPLRVCIVGQDPFGSVLERTIHGEVIAGRRLVVERFPRPERLPQCHLVFVSGGTVPVPILDAVATAPVLTIGESEAFADAGGIIVFVPESGRVRFEVNRTQAGRRGLRLNARLLQVAMRVR